jgi:hypothetical protein
MNTRQRILIVSSVFLSLLIPKVQATPNHLEPIPPYSLDMDGTSDEYRQAVFTSLIGRGWLPSLWMIEKPSSSRAYAVVLQRTVEFDPNDTRPFSEREIKRKPWVVSYTALNEEIRREKIWRSKAANGRIPITYEIRPTKNVESHSAPITPEFAKVVREAWLSTLQLTRYAQGDRGGGLDGTTLDFFCCDDPFAGGLFGQTWSPKTGLPAMLADLGRKLRAIALSDEKNRDSLLAEADSLARKIAKDAEAERIRLFGKKMSQAH